MDARAIEEVRKVADQVEARRIPPPNREQSVIIIRQMVGLAEQVHELRTALQDVVPFLTANYLPETKSDPAVERALAMAQKVGAG